MQINIDQEDDCQVLEAMQEFAKQLRRRHKPAGALTAAKLELFLSKALEEISPATATPATPEAGK
jgi:hypothetical protein